jgi:5-methylcytosine-specific restriction protein A
MRNSKYRLRGRPLQRRNKRFLQENPLCVMCESNRRVSAAEEVDHIIPLHKGGADEWWNLQGLCRECHAKKTSKDMGYQMSGCDVNGNPLSDDHWWKERNGNE